MGAGRDRRRGEGPAADWSGLPATRGGHRGGVSIPDFDDNGNLPPGRHPATVEELEAALVGRFPTSTTRSAIFRYWIDHRQALLDLVEVHCQWIAGSFASDKPDPADSDVVTVLDGLGYDTLPRHRQLTIQSLIAGHYTESFWHCDAYPVLLYPEDHPGHTMYRIAVERWEDYFGHDRDGNECGFVEVSGQ